MVLSGDQDRHLHLDKGLLFLSSFLFDFLRNLLPLDLPSSPSSTFLSNTKEDKVKPMQSTASRKYTCHFFIYNEEKAPSLYRDRASTKEVRCLYRRLCWVSLVPQSVHHGSWSF